MDNNIEATAVKRGAFLWVMLVIFMLGCFLRLISILFPMALPIYTGGPSWDYIFNIFAFVIETGGLVGIITWRRWGIYLMALAYVTEVVVDFAYYTLRPSIAEGLLNLILFVLLVWAVRRRWSYFR